MKGIKMFPINTKKAQGLWSWFVDLQILSRLLHGHRPARAVKAYYCVLEVYK